MKDELLAEVDAINDVVTISRKAKRKMALKNLKLSTLGALPFFRNMKTSCRIPLTENKFYKVNPQNG